jgi:hypothetical protein
MMLIHDRLFFRSTICLSLVAFSALAGCAKSDHPPTVHVSGRVTLEGKPFPRAGLVSFATLEPAEGFPSHPAAAAFDESGNYTVGAFGRGDGIVPGKYRVAVECWTKPYSGDGPKPPSYVPEKYRSVATSDVELTVQPGEPAKKFDIDLSSQ